MPLYLICGFEIKANFGGFCFFVHVGRRIWGDKWFLMGNGRLICGGGCFQ